MDQINRSRYDRLTNSYGNYPGIRILVWQGLFIIIE